MQEKGVKGRIIPPNTKKGQNTPFFVVFGGIDKKPYFWYIQCDIIY